MESIEKVITAVSMKDFQTKKELRKRLPKHFSHHHYSVSKLDRALRWLVKYNIIFKVSGLCTGADNFTVKKYIINEAFR